MVNDHEIWCLHMYHHRKMLPLSCPVWQVLGMVWQNPGNSKIMISARHEYYGQEHTFAFVG